MCDPCNSTDLQDLASFDILNQNVSEKLCTSTRLNYHNHNSSFQNDYLLSSCLSAISSSFGDLYTNYNHQNLFLNHARLPPLVSAATPWFGFNQSPLVRRGYADNIQQSNITPPIIGPIGSNPMASMNATNPNSFRSLPLDSPSLNNGSTPFIFKQEALISSKTSNTAHNKVIMSNSNIMASGEVMVNKNKNARNLPSLEEICTSALTPIDLSGLHWKSPAAKTRAARKRRMAKNRLLNEHITTVAARSKTLGIWPSTLSTTNEDPSFPRNLMEKETVIDTPTSNEKV